MNLFFKDVFGFFKVFEDVYGRIRRLLVPPKAYSWQTLIYLSLFSWIMSYFATEGLVKDIIAFLGWMFLIAGTAWYTTDSPILIPNTSMPLGSLITGFLVSVFAFGHPHEITVAETWSIWSIVLVTPRTVVFWPTFSALITAIPEFFEGSGTDSKTQLPKTEDRQRVIVLIACCMVLSCWLQLYFLVDSWVAEYPSLQVDNFERSSLVVKTDPSTKTPENGVLILNKLEPLVKGRLAAKSWSEVEIWLKNANQEVAELGKQVIDKHLEKFDEKALWHVEPRIVNIKTRKKLDGYRLDLLSIWTGPSSNSRRYYLRKSCRISPIAGSGGNTPNTQGRPNDTFAEVECDKKSSFFGGSPPANK
jgi:hypothetical protein